MSRLRKLFSLLSFTQTASANNPENEAEIAMFEKDIGEFEAQLSQTTEEAFNEEGTFNESQLPLIADIVRCLRDARKHLAKIKAI